MNDITLKGIIDEDFVNYKVPSMTIMFPKCSFKCGNELCQNKTLINESNIIISIDQLCERYLSNPISEAIVCQGLEPFDSFEELFYFIKKLRYKYHCYDEVVIYTGYDSCELLNEIIMLKYFKPIIIKFGRYVPNIQPRYDELLGVTLASSNQYAKRVEDI